MSHLSCLRLRLSIYDEDSFSGDEELGEVYLRLSEIDPQDPAYRFGQDALSSDLGKANKGWGTLKTNVAKNGGGWGAMASALMGNPEKGEVYADLEEAGEVAVEDGLALDMWHKLKATESMRVNAEKNKEKLPDYLGEVRIRTRVQQSHSRRAEKDDDDSSTVL